LNIIVGSPPAPIGGADRRRSGPWQTVYFPTNINAFTLTQDGVLIGCWNTIILLPPYCRIASNTFKRRLILSGRTVSQLALGRGSPA